MPGARRSRIVVIGAGVGGLTAAIALRRAGNDVEVYEQADPIRPVGAGLTLQPNAVTALARIGLDRAIVEAGHTLAGTVVRHYRGRELRGVHVDGSDDRRVVGIHRATLHRVLSAQLESDVVRTGHTLTSVDVCSDHVRARFANGAVVEADVLVGADGLHSATRAALLGDGPPLYAGYVCVRGVSDEVAAPDGLEEWWGPGTRFGIMPIDGRRTYWYFTWNQPTDEAPSDRLRERVLERLGGWPEGIRNAVERTPSHRMMCHAAYDRDPVEGWGRGLATLLGDAAHCMTPNMGQGACQAIEDAVVLADSLSNAPDPATGLRAYERRRTTRTGWFVRESRRMGRLGQMEHAWMRWLRDVVTAKMPNGAVERRLTRAWAFLDG